MKSITLLTAATATNSPPTATSNTVGVDIPFLCDQAVVFVHSTAGSNVMTATVRLWGFSRALQRWFPLGSGTTPGVLNAGVAIPEISADYIAYAEPVANLRAFERLYAEITAIAGTSTAVTVTADCCPASAVTES